jgi:hypothetical protein
MIANHRSIASALSACGAALLLTVASAPTYAAATIIIQNGNAAGVGFNDPTPAAPVGGNTGVTLGQQRLNAFQAAANTWGATLTSTANVTILATFEPLTCTATSAVLGSAGAISVFRDFPGAPFPNTWYSSALANKLVGADLDTSTPEIRARFNSNLGLTGCLTGVPFYLGLDNAHGPAIDLVTVLLHEFGHGFGFQTFTNGTSGAYLAGFPSVYDNYLLDTTVNKLWVNMTNAERATSALNSRRLVWTGANVGAAVPNALALGTPFLSVTTPASVAGQYLVGTASFGPPLATPGVTGEIMPVVDSAGSIGLACTPLSALNAAAVNGKLAVVDRGTCTFNVKAKFAQDAGAIGVIVVDNVAGGPPAGLGGADPTVTIPSVRITLADGTTLKNALRTRSRLHSGVFATLAVDMTTRSGADGAGRPMVFTPNPFQSGSSVSHWDTSATPNLLMEPAINVDLTHTVVPPVDLTFSLLQDEGW